VNNAAAFSFIRTQGFHIDIADGALDDNPVNFIKVICSVCTIVPWLYAKWHYNKTSVFFRHINPPSTFRLSTST
jgi:hypothetical protein